MKYSVLGLLSTLGLVSALSLVGDIQPVVPPIGNFDPIEVPVVVVPGTVDGGSSGGTIDVPPPDTPPEACETDPRGLECLCWQEPFHECCDMCEGNQNADFIACWALDCPYSFDEDNTAKCHGHVDSNDNCAFTGVSGFTGRLDGHLGVDPSDDLNSFVYYDPNGNVGGGYNGGGQNRANGGGGQGGPNIEDLKNDLATTSTSIFTPQFGTIRVSAGLYAPTSGPYNQEIDTVYLTNSNTQCDVLSGTGCGSRVYTLSGSSQEELRSWDMVYDHSGKPISEFDYIHSFQVLFSYHKHSDTNYCLQTSPTGVPEALCNGWNGNQPGCACNVQMYTPAKNKYQPTQAVYAPTWYFRQMTLQSEKFDIPPGIAWVHGHTSANVDPNRGLPMYLSTFERHAARPGVAEAEMCGASGTFMSRRQWGNSVDPGAPSWNGNF